MKICLIYQRVGKSFGGAAFVIFLIAQGLKKKGLDVHIITRKIDDTAKEFFNAKEIHIIKNEHLIFFELISIIQQQQFNIIHYFGYNSFWPFQLGLISRLFKTIAIFTPHFHPFGKKPIVIRKIFDVSLGLLSFIFSNGIIITSPREGKYSILNIFKYKTFLIPNPFNKVHRTIKKDLLMMVDRDIQKVTNILFVGRLDYNKGLLLLLKVMKNIMEKNDRISLYIVGKDFGLKKQMEKYIEINQLSNIYIMGFLDDEQLKQQFINSHIFVLPSTYEAFGMVLLEAMYFKLPIIASDIGGIPFVLNYGKAGFLVPPNNLLKLQVGIEKILYDKKLRCQMIKNYKFQLQKFDIKNICKVTINLYRFFK